MWPKNIANTHSNMLENIFKYSILKQEFNDKRFE